MGAHTASGLAEALNWRSPALVSVILTRWVPSAPKRRSRAPGSSHGEYEQSEYGLPSEADPPPALPLVGGSLLRGNEFLLREKQVAEILRMGAHLGCDLAVAHRLTLLNGDRQRVVGQEPDDLRIAEPAHRSNRHREVVRLIAGDNYLGQRLRPRLIGSHQLGDDIGRCGLR